MNGIEKFLFSMLDLWGWEAIEDEIKLAGYVRWALFTLHYLLVAFRGKVHTPGRRQSKTLSTIDERR